VAVHADGVTADHPGSDAAPHTVNGGTRLGGDAELRTQLTDLRARLMRDAAPAGIDPASVERTIDETARTYESAVVRSFLAVLIERDVRARLNLRTSTGSTVDPG
jgi:hypothetical protein